MEAKPREQALMDVPDTDIASEVLAWNEGMPAMVTATLPRLDAR